MVIGAVLFAVSCQAVKTSYPVGGGRTVYVSTDLKSGGNGNDSGSVIEVRRLGRLETRVTGRGAPDGLSQKVL